MERNSRPMVIWYRESMVQSIVADIMTFAFIAILFAFNHFYLGDSKVAGVAFFILFIVYTIGKSSSRKDEFYSLEDARDHIEKEIIKESE